MCPPFCQFYKKVVLLLSERGDAIETQTIKVCPPPQSFLANSIVARADPMSAKSFSTRVNLHFLSIDLKLRVSDCKLL